jgi:GR25 family glycosyltransferase involved in LPS biosynthesis
MKIFVVHYKKLANRKTHIERQFQKYNITDYEFVEIDRDELSAQNMSMFPENYSKSQIAICLSHFYAYQQISAHYEEGLIFEDDVILSDYFTDRLNRYRNQLSKEYDMLFLGDGCQLHIQKHRIIPGKYIYEKCLYPTEWGGDGAGRCTDSYLVSKKCAKTMIGYIDKLTMKINLPIDWWLNVAARDNHFKVYWAEPTIVTQGTQNGFFKTSH